MAERINDFTQEKISTDSQWINDIPKGVDRIDMILVENPVRFNKWWAGKSGTWLKWEIEEGRPYVASEDGQIPMELVKDGKYGLNIQTGSYAFLVICEGRIKIWEVTKAGLKNGLLSISRRHKGKFDGIRVIATRNVEGDKTSYSVTDVERVELGKEQAQLVSDNYIDLVEKYSPDVFNAPTERTGTYTDQSYIDEADKALR